LNALDDGGPTRQALRRFSVGLTVASLAGMLAVTATPLADIYRGIAPFFVVQLAGLLAITFLPGLSLTLANLL